MIRLGWNRNVREGDDNDKSEKGSAYKDILLLAGTLRQGDCNFKVGK